MAARTVLRRTAVVVVVVSAFVLGAPTLPAAASPLRGQPGTFIWDAAGNQHQLCKFSSGCIRYGNIVRLWQSILYADGRMRRGRLTVSSDRTPTNGPCIGRASTCPAISAAR